MRSRNTTTAHVASDAQAAYEQLMRQAEALAASGKYHSVASAFSALFSDQRNAELAARAHKCPDNVQNLSHFRE
jgi:hypothetical protein